jgi:8-oxo-dGTP diphosphatase
MEIIILETGFKDGEYGLPAGHLEEGEHPSATIIRESKEEIGVDISPEHLRCVHIVQRQSGKNDPKDYVDFFFVCDAWKGEPENLEPHKCDDLQWFPLDRLPTNTIDYTKKVLSYVESGQFYSEQ